MLIMMMTSTSEFKKQIICKNKYSFLIYLMQLDMLRLPAKATVCKFSVLTDVNYRTFKGIIESKTKPSKMKFLW